VSHIFISHVEEDADVTLEIALGLEEAGYTTWFYELDSIPGPSYLLQTGQAIEQSEAVVLVISPHALGSRQITKEVVRAHESDKQFIPMLRDITHVEFQNRQPEWRAAVGAAASVQIPPEGVVSILTRVADGLKALGILPASTIDAKRVDRIRKELDRLTSRVMPVRGRKDHADVGMEAALPGQPVAAVKRAAPRKPTEEKVSNWWWLLPIFIGFVGGIISWALNKDANWRKARKMLVFGILFTAIWLVLVPLFVFYIPMDSTAPSPTPTPAPTLTPTSTPTPITPGTVLYSDDFSDPSSSWDTFGDPWGSAFYQDEWFHIMSPGYEGVFFAQHRIDQYFTDFILEVDMRLVVGTDYDYQLIFCRVDLETENYYAFVITALGNYEIFSGAGYLAGEWLVWPTFSTHIHTGQGVTNSVHVEFIGSTLSLSVNGHLLAEVTDYGITGGYIGFGAACFDESQFTEVAFDNFVVTVP